MTRNTFTGNSMSKVLSWIDSAQLLSGLHLPYISFSNSCTSVINSTHYLKFNMFFPIPLLLMLLLLVLLLLLLLLPPPLIIIIIIIIKLQTNGTHTCPSQCVKREMLQCYGIKQYIRTEKLQQIGQI